MKARLIGLALFCAATGALAVTQSAAGGSYLVVFKGESLPPNAAVVIERAGAQVRLALPEVGVASIAANPKAAAALAKDPAVLAVGPEHVYGVPGGLAITDGAETAGSPLPADTRYAYQWNLRRIHAPALWARLPLAGATPVVAVLDTGVMYDHPDLQGQVIANVSASYCPTQGAGAYPIYTRKIAFQPDGSASCEGIAAFYEGHGTHVAGIIAAKFGGGRAIGVDPDIRIAAYKVFDYATLGDSETFGAFDGAVFRAMLHAANNGIGVINLSLGQLLWKPDGDDRASWLSWKRVADQVNRKGTVVVAAAMNDGANLNGPLGSIPGDLPTVVCVSASGWSELVLSEGLWVPAPGSHDVLASYSNFGAAVDLTAPGGDCVGNCPPQYAIYSDYIFEAGEPGYAWLFGTSMAAPHVSAIAAAVRALHPDWEPGTVRSYLKDTAENLGNRQAFGHGMITADQVQ